MGYEPRCDSDAFFVLALSMTRPDITLVGVIAFFL